MTQQRRDTRLAPPANGRNNFNENDPEGPEDSHRRLHVLNGYLR